MIHEDEEDDLVIVKVNGKKYIIPRCYVPLGFKIEELNKEFIIKEDKQ